MDWDNILNGIIGFQKMYPNQVPVCFLCGLE